MQGKTENVIKGKEKNKKVEKTECIITPSKQAIINQLEMEKKSLKRQMVEVENYLKELKK